MGVYIAAYTSLLVLAPIVVGDDDDVARGFGLSGAVVDIDSIVREKKAKKLGTEGNVDRKIDNRN